MECPNCGHKTANKSTELRRKRRAEGKCPDCGVLLDPNRRTKRVNCRACRIVINLRVARKAAERKI